MDVKPAKTEKTEDVDQEVEDTTEDPNELLDIGQDNVDSSVWLVKVPKGLMKRWAAVQREGVPLCTLRIYQAPQGTPNHNRMTLTLPDNPEYDTGDEPKDWEFAMEANTTHSQYVISDQPHPQSNNKRARYTRMQGKVSVRGRLQRSLLTDDYSRKMRERVEAVKPKRHIKLLTDASLSETGSNLKMLQSGAIQTNAGFNTAVGRGVSNASSSRNKEPFERAARISRDELLDQLFALFTPEAEYWSLKDLRKRTSQPEAYLKEILGDIAEFHRFGPHNNMFSLKEQFKSASASSSKAEAAKGEAKMEIDAKMEEDEQMEDGDDDEDEDDWEAIAE